MQGASRQSDARRQVFRKKDEDESHFGSLKGKSLTRKNHGSRDFGGFENKARATKATSLYYLILCVLREDLGVVNLKNLH